ncbi:lysozyme inhibitor LprI family protein [Acinetobacter guillouiae]|uniref:lysozyme inhibitor LprI family protein n=1 Tax=Acinetobacter guillouiae TaxID=106649 RepID=UPI0028ECD287|nr:lysozyme inhibitor LprI family protein [Acinetobacter guillouiae]
MYLKYWGISLVVLLPMHTQAIGYSSDYLSCMNSAGSSSETLASCMKTELSKQDDRLKSLFKQTLDLYTDKQQKAQKKYQKQWFKLRDQQCDESNKSISDDYKMKYYNCALKQTVNRANMLEKQSYRL